MSPPTTALTGWGRTAPSRATTVRLTDAEQVAAAVRRAAEDPAGRGVVARGLGRSYGDPAQNAGGTVLDLTGLDRIRAVDTAGGVVELDAGVSLDALVRALLPLGWWVPVVPGTRQVTVGGAVAADVHGKNHHVAGSFGDHVLDLDLIDGTGTLRTVSREVDPDLFHATLGGMGLTGVITRVRLRCTPVESAYVVVDTERTDDLDGLFAVLADDKAHPYSVAWFDTVATGRRLGRSVVTRGRPARLDELDVRRARRPLDLGGRTRLTVPTIPSNLVNATTGRLFNEAWWRTAPRHRRGQLQPAAGFFWPLDGLARWNRLYGPRGFCQYQLVVPLDAADAVREVAERIARSPHVSCLSVLKRFGPGNDAPLSFPMRGWTLAVDLAVRPGLAGLLRDLDAVVLAAGGRLYLAKDSRLRPEHLAAMYPRLADFRAVRARVDPAGVFTSDLARRLAL